MLCSRLKFLILIFILSVSLPTAAKSQLYFPYDNGGYLVVEIVGNYLTISGTIINVDSVPDFKDLIQWNSPCAEVVLVSEWDCANPAQPGYRSLAFVKLLRIVFDDGCEGQIAIWIKGHMEMGLIRVDSDRNYYVAQVEIRDACGIRLDKRELLEKLRVDPMDLVSLYVLLRSNNVRFEFPTTLEGKIRSCSTVSVYLGMQNSAAGWAEYSAGPMLALDLLPSDPGTSNVPISFSVEFRNSPHYSARIRKYLFGFKDFIYSDNIPLSGEDNLIVCYPWGSHLTFGSTINIIDDGWPSECRDHLGTVSGYDNNIKTECISTAGTIQQDTFTTVPQASCYEIIQGDIPYRDIDFAFAIQVDDGTEEDLFNGYKTIRVYNGFSANPIPAIDPLNVGDSTNIFAQPVPTLDPGQTRIRYEWLLQPSNLAHLVPGGYPRGYGQRFIADAPGIVNISYTIRDTLSFTFAQSPQRTVTIRPTITITTPPAGDKFTFGPQNPGILSIRCAATTGNSAFDQDIEWSITPMPTCTLNTNPDPPRGPNMTFNIRGLPLNNDEFGLKYVKAQIPNRADPESVMVKAYYPADARNHPNPGNMVTPNWYYYWGQDTVFANPRAYSGQYCNDTTYGYFVHRGYTWGDTETHICDLASFINISPGYPSWHDGIDCFGEVCRHEQNHYLNWWAWWGNSQYDSLYADVDSDLIPSILEPAFGLDSLLGDSSLPPYPSGIPDFEKLAYNVMRSWIAGSRDSIDWAKPGHQY